MKTIEILDHVAPVLLREVEKAIPQVDSTKKIVGILSSHRDLMSFVPRAVWRFYPRKGIRRETLDSWERLWCLAEMLVVAVRLRQASRESEWELQRAETPLSRASVKIRTEDLCMRRGVRLLLQHILEQPGAESIHRLVLTEEGSILGMVARPGKDLAAVDELPIFIGFCHLEVAIRQICRLSEEFGLSLPERGAMLDALPRVSESPCDWLAD